MIDGSRTEPHLTCLLAMECACETAAAEGIGMVLVRGLLPVRRLRLYEKVAAAHGLVAEVREAVYADETDAKITHSFLAVDPGHFGDRESLSPLLIEFAQKTGNVGIPGRSGVALPAPTRAVSTQSIKIKISSRSRPRSLTSGTRLQPRWR